MASHEAAPRSSQPTSGGLQAAAPTQTNKPPSLLIVAFYHLVSKMTNPKAVLPLIVSFAAILLTSPRFPIRQQLLSFGSQAPQLVATHPVLCLLTALVISHLILTPILLSWLRTRRVYLVDYACFRQPKELQMPRQKMIEHCRLTGAFNEQSMEFMSKITMRSGLGDRTYLPAALHEVPPQPSIGKAHDEAHLVMFSTVQDLFDKTRVKPADIDILVVNCSLFCPTPSLSAAIVNHFKLRSDVKSFNLGGMGCSANIISVALVQDILKAHPNKRALVVSLENQTMFWYAGNERSRLLSNCLFRMGGAALLLSNRPADSWRAKMELRDIVRTHTGRDDPSFNCVELAPDEQGNLGVSLSKDLIKVAGESLHRNIMALGPRVLPLSEKIIYLAVLVARKVLGMKHLKTYVPDFRLAFEHFCIHAGGRAVLDAMEKNLKLLPHHIEPSRMTLHRFGNTSSSSIWYEFAYLEAKGRLHAGDRLWQIAFGSGFKCNSAVWRVMRSQRGKGEGGPWEDCIHEYPMQIVDGLSSQ